MKIGSATTDLTSGAYGDRSGGVMAALARNPGDTGTLWAATSTGRLFISANANDASPGNVVWNRVDGLCSTDPGRFVSGIAPVPGSANTAYVSYTGYSASTPGQPGHVFLVVLDSAGSPSSATCTDLNIEGVNGDLPVTALAYDNVANVLYSGTDFGVLAYDGVSWSAAGTGLPIVEVAGLTILPAKRLLFAATHGMSAWQMLLPTPS